VKVHHVTVSAFSTPEGLEGLRNVLKRLLPEEAQVEGRYIEPETDGGVFTKELYEVRCRLTKQADMKEFLKKVFGRLDEYDRGMVLKSLPDLIDDECNMYLRLSKAEASDGNIVLETKDPIHITIKLAAYPARKENAATAAKEMVDEML